MGALWKYPAPTRGVPNNFADDLIFFDPGEPPDSCEFVVRPHLNRSHRDFLLRCTGMRLTATEQSFRNVLALGTLTVMRTSFTEKIVPISRVADILAPSHLQGLIENSAVFAAFAFEQASATDASEQIDDEIWNAFWQSGLGLSPFDENNGGAALSEACRHQALCDILRMLGSADLSIARLFEGHVNAIALVSRYGNPEQIRELAKSVAQGNLAAVWGADDATGLRLVSKSGQQKLDGRKILASGAGFVARPLVTAADNEGQVMCLLDLTGNESVDLSAWQAQGMRSTATGSIELSGIAIGANERIGLADDFMRQPFFSGGAWRFCAAHVGATERLVDLFRQHLVARGRDSDPYQLERVAQSAASVKTARFWVEEAARRFATVDPDPAALVAFVNLTRIVIERSALDVMQAVQRGVGLTSFVRPSPIERICRDLATYLRQPVPDLAMADAARGLLKSPLSVGDF